MCVVSATVGLLVCEGFQIVAFLVFVYFSRFRYGLTCICVLFLPV